MRRGFAAVAAGLSRHLAAPLALTASLGSPAPAAEISVQATPVEIAAPPGGRLRVVGATALTSADPGFGGFSGLALGGDGALIAISDRGRLATGLPRPGGAARVAATLSPLIGEDGAPVGPKAYDAEGLAIDPADGALYVSFEGDHRVWRYAGADAPPQELPRDPAWERLQTNSGLEALALGPGGALYAIPERSGAADRPFPVWRRAGAGWEALALPRSGAFLVTDADFGPDGRLYVLERSFSWLGGFAMRLRRGAIPAAGGTIETETLVTLGAGSGVDNMEGLAVTGDGAGGLRLLVISDDNFNPLQRTILIEFALRD